MKKGIGFVICLALVILCAAALADVKINETNFPDDQFREAVKRADKNKDGSLSENETARVTGLYLQYRSISDLKGLEYFTALTELYCENNQLTALDVSKNTALTKLDCSDNQLKTLDLSNNTELIHLRCKNNQLTSLNVNRNRKLNSLQCAGNQLKTLDISRNPVLDQLDCYDNQLTKLDISHNTALQHLDCSNNLLAALDSHKNTSLIYLHCDGNRLTSLDVSKNKVLYRLRCGNNRLEVLDVQRNTALNDLQCSGNRFTSLDVSKNTALHSLDCSGNLLKTLDLSRNDQLDYLNCSGNQLQTLDVSRNTRLNYLRCGSNALKQLDVSKHPDLRELSCESNQLSKLNINNTNELNMLNCSGNRLNQLDISRSEILRQLVCERIAGKHKVYGYGWWHAQGSGEDEYIWEALFADRSVRVITGNEIMLNADAFPDGRFRKYVSRFDLDGNGIIYSVEAEKATEIRVSGLQIRSLKGVEVFTALSVLWCDNNQLTSLDVSQNAMLTELHCEHNRLKKLDISKCELLNDLVRKHAPETKNGVNRWSAAGPGKMTADQAVKMITADYDPGILLNTANFPDELFRKYVKQFDADQNGILSREETEKATVIDVKYMEIHDLKGLEFFTELTTLYCDENYLTALDVSHCPALTELTCDGNQLTSLDLSKNPALERLTVGAYNSSWSGNPLSSLDISRNKALYSLSCINTGIQSLDVSGCPRLLNLVLKGSRKRVTDFSPTHDEWYDSSGSWLSVRDDAFVTAGEILSTPDGIYRLNQDKTAAVYVRADWKKADSLKIRDTVVFGKTEYKVAEIKDSACKGLKKLASLTIGKNVSMIGKDAFRDCPELKTITVLGSGLKKIGKKAFSGINKEATVCCEKKLIKKYKKLMQKAGLPKNVSFQAK